MIIEQQTNNIYFSELLPAWYLEEFIRIKQILNKYELKPLLLKKTRDIWCRDYMPIQTSVNDFVQFKFDPKYLKGKDSKFQSDPKIVNKANDFPPFLLCVSERFSGCGYATRTGSGRVYKEPGDSGASLNPPVGKIQASPLG